VHLDLGRVTILSRGPSLLLRVGVEDGQGQSIPVVAMVGLRKQGGSRSHELLALARSAMARDGSAASATCYPRRRPAVGRL
jgi:hypothetical protein